MHGILIEQPGGPEVLAYRELPDPRPGPGEVLVAVEAAGVNFIDIYHRTGLYPRAHPYTPGQEGAGTVLALGPGVDGPPPGRRVAWTDGGGSYAERVTVAADRLVPLPDGVPGRTAAAAMLQGLTAHYLAHDSFPLRPGTRCLVQAAAGGVGLLLVQLARRLGAEVFATVGSPAKAELAAAAGAHHVIEYRDRDWAAEVERIAGPRPLDVVYDGVGRATFTSGLTLLRRRGTMVTFGNASGPVDPVSPLTLMTQGSLFLTRPTLGDHIATPEELRRRAGELFALIEDGRLDVRIGLELPLAAAGEAHTALAERRTTGKVLLRP